MGKTLIIAEKPSVAGDIAKALGGFKKVDDFYESDQYVVSSAVGHLLDHCAAGRRGGGAGEMDVQTSARHPAAF